MCSLLDNGSRTHSSNWLKHWLRNRLEARLIEIGGSSHANNRSSCLSTQTRQGCLRRNCCRRRGADDDLHPRDRGGLAARAGVGTDDDRAKPCGAHGGRRIRDSDRTCVSLRFAVARDREEHGEGQGGGGMVRSPAPRSTWRSTTSRSGDSSGSLSIPTSRRTTSSTSSGAASLPRRPPRTSSSRRQTSAP